MKFALIGTGFIMPRHAEAIYHVGGKIIDVVNTAYGEEVWREVIGNTPADCVVILTPNDLHEPMARAALERGKIVLSEKPLAIKTEHVAALAKHPNVFTVLQLHYHPLVKKLRIELDPAQRHDVELDIAVYRDPSYYASWKGHMARSGGVLYNLGIHYFDLLIHLFGEPTTMATKTLDEKTGTGVIKGENYSCAWRVSTDEAREKQRRVFKIDGVPYNFSSHDNLSYENLHRYVYEDLVRGKGTRAAEALPSVRLVENLYKSYKAA